MAKKVKIISEVAFKEPHSELILRNGLHLTKDNLTIERYEKVIALSESFKEFFNVKLITPKNDEMEGKK